MFYFICWTLLAGLVSVLADRKGRTPVAWFFYGFLLFPIAIIHVWFAEPNRETLDWKQVRSGNKRCPLCAEFVRIEAVRCRFCGADVSPNSEVWVQGR